MLKDTINVIESMLTLAVAAGKEPKHLVINEDYLNLLATCEGFWEAPQFKTLVKSTAPVLNKFYSPSKERILVIVPSNLEILFHLE